jgi:hypothetical protein
VSKHQSVGSFLFLLSLPTIFLPSLPIPFALPLPILAAPFPVPTPTSLAVPSAPLPRSAPALPGCNVTRLPAAPAVPLPRLSAPLPAPLPNFLAALPDLLAGARLSLLLLAAVLHGLRLGCRLILRRMRRPRKRGQTHDNQHARRRKKRYEFSLIPSFSIL